MKKFIPQKRNANKHTSYGLRLLEESLQRDGFIDAQTAAADGEIISGSARMEMVEEKFEGVEPIVVHSDGKRPVIVVRDDIPNAESARARRLSVAANQIAKVDFDPDGELLKEWAGEDAAIRKMFADSEWMEITGEEPATVDAEPQIDRAAELLEKWQVKTGDLWQIGEHRLICGDCTDKAVVERVMGGEKAGMVFTDPPYGMNLDTDYKPRKGSNKAMKKEIRGKTYEPVIGDGAEYNPEQLLEMFGDVNEIFLWGADYYSKYLEQGGWFVWDKCVTSDGKVSEAAESMIGSSFELCWSKQKHKRTIVRKYHRGFTSVDVSKRYHPTQKPIQLFEWFIDKFSKAGDIVWDGYIGSGTTLVACQNLGRRGRAIEISPAYCAVTLERMATAFPDIEIKRLE